jgi:hypothetical protein
MPEPSIARQTLAKARLFGQQAEHSELECRDAFQANLEAAIVFGRSVTFHVQKEFAHQEDFVTSYTLYQHTLKNDPLAQFFLESRNFILKQGPAGVKRVIGAEMHDTINIACTVDVKVIRGQPWYRRKPSILWSDLKTPLVLWINRTRQRWKRKRTRDMPRQEAVSTITEEYFFMDEKWANRPALELLHTWLNKLEIIVTDAEQRFSV